MKYTSDKTTTDLALKVLGQTVAGLWEGCIGPFPPTAPIVLLHTGTPATSRAIPALRKAGLISTQKHYRNQGGHSGAGARKGLRIHGLYVSFTKQGYEVVGALIAMAVEIQKARIEPFDPSI